MAVCLPAPTTSDPAAERSVRVMRWIFRREDAIVVCELGLNREESAYEIRVYPPGDPAGVTTEVFDDAVAAFERHGAIERRLVDEGWSLERFDSRLSAAAP